MEELKPCPFCGGVADLKWIHSHKYGGKYGTFAFCTMCSAQSKAFWGNERPEDFDTAECELATSAWNNRR